MNPNNAIPLREPFDEVTSIDSPSATTVVVRVHRASASFLSEFATAPIVPAHLLQRLPTLNVASFNALPIGTGPFRVIAWRRGDRVDLAANLRYYAGRPRLRSLSVVFLADDNSAQVALRTGELDAIYAPTIEVVRALRANPNFRLVTVDENAVEMLAMNTTVPPLGDQRVREAIALAIDRVRLVQVVSDGLYAPANGPIPATHWAGDSRAPLSYDPARARAVLAGHARTLMLTIPSGSATVATTALLLQSMLRAVGIDLQLRTLQPNVMFGSYAAGGALETGKYQLAIYGFASGPDPDLSTLFACRSRPPTAYNQSRYCNPRFDAILYRANFAGDRYARSPLFRILARMVVADAPVVFLWWPRRFVIVRRDVRGLARTPHANLTPSMLWATDRSP